MTTSSKTSAQNCYSILGLPSPLSGRYVGTQQIRAAFRHSLLVHHPDKATDIVGWNDASPLTTGQKSAKHSVDEICHARDVLTDPSLRREHDHLLAQNAPLSSGSAGVFNGSLATSEQVESVDLDDMEYSEATQTWTRVCRCGNAKAYEVSEEDLTSATCQGSREISVGCDGCSLHIRVLFDTEDEHEILDSKK